MKIVELEKQEFIDFCNSNPQALFFQSPYWIEIKEQNGWSGKILGVKEDGKIVIATVLLFKSIKGIIKFAYAPRGFLMDYDNFALLAQFTKEIKDYLKKENVAFLKINPYIDYQLRDINGNVIEGTKKDILMVFLDSLGYKHYGFYVDMDEKKDLEPRWISVLDIKGKTIDDLFKTFRSGTKWGINNSKKNFITLIEADESNLIEFKNLMQHTAERREFVDRPLSYYQEMFKVLNRENAVKVLLAEVNLKELLDFTKARFEKNAKRLTVIEGNPKNINEYNEIKSQQESIAKKIESLTADVNKYGDKKIIAGGWYMLYGREVVYLFGASYKPFMKYNSQYLLQYEMIKFVTENGYDKFNFYGIDGNFNEDSKNYGLFDFKRGFNADVHELIGEFDLIINKPQFTLYELIFKGYKILKTIQKKI
ncbi:MAG: peptidoglycan bridge formation glycyltransferase FemA/FemB family protein [Clostridia bacterium]|nr:peptidoglycan bridge formation glycyltransferase FemA/FemB family protein [Clostridia bacterium]